MAEIHLLQQERHHDVALCAALLDMIKMIEQGEITTLCVTGLCIGKEGVFSMIPPTDDADIVKLIGAVRLLEKRLLDRIQT